MTSEFFTSPFLVFPKRDLEVNVEKGKYTSDDKLKLKLRDVNLVKYNPVLFTNRGSGFFDLIGGNKTLMTILTTASLAVAYRFRANQLRNISFREGIWLLNIYFWYGAFLGSFYSAVYFWRWQIHFNDITANFLVKRFAGAGDLKNENIYRLKDVENDDMIYNFSNSFIRNYHK